MVEELPCVLPPLTLGDVRRNRNGRPPYLTRQPKQLLLRKLPRDLVAFLRQLHPHPPHFQIPITLNAHSVVLLHPPPSTRRPLPAPPHSPPSTLHPPPTPHPLPLHLVR